MKSKITLVLVLLVFVFVGLGVYLKLADSNAENSGGKTGEGGSESGGKTRGGSSVTILCPPDAAELFRELADNYQTENTPQFIVEELESANYDQTVVKKLQEKKSADIVVFTQATDPPSAEARTSLRELSSLKGLEDTLLRLEEGENLTLLPLCGDIPVVFYNADLFQEKGLGAPSSLSEFQSLCVHFLAQGSSPVGVALEQGAKETPLLPLLESYLLNNVAPPPPEMVMSAFFDSLAEVEIFEQGSASDRTQCFAAFRDGICPMFAGYFSDCALLESMNLPFRYDAFLLFGERPELNGALIPAVSVAVSKEAAEGAEDFVTYLLSEAAQKLLCNKSAAKPIRENAASLAENEEILYSRVVSSGLKPSPLSALSAEKRELLLKEIARAVAGEEADFEQIQNILSISDSLKGDVP